MLRSDLPALPEIPTLEDDPALFDPAPEWFVPGCKPSLREEHERDAGDAIGFRALIERPAALSKAWRSSHRAPRVERRQAGRSPRWSDAA